MTALSPRQMFILDLACQPIAKSWGNVYLVGTAGVRGPYRDVDVRLILPDKRYDRLQRAVGPGAVSFLGMAIGQYLATLTDLPIDFCIQRQTEANLNHSGSRNPLGVREINEFPGDARGAV